MAVGLVVSTDDTRASLIQALLNLNQQAKDQRRRGYAGVYGQRMSELHAQMDTLVDGILFRDHLGLD